MPLWTTGMTRGVRPGEGWGTMNPDQIAAAGPGVASITAPGVSRSFAAGAGGGLAPPSPPPDVIGGFGPTPAPPMGSPPPMGRLPMGGAVASPGMGTIAGNLAGFSRPSAFGGGGGTIAGNINPRVSPDPMMGGRGVPLGRMPGAGGVRRAPGGYARMPWRY